MIVRLAVAVLALAAGAAVVAVAVLVLRGTPGPVSVAPTVLPAVRATPSFPAPPANSVVFSREDGADALALAVVPRGKSVLVQASVVGPQGTGVDGLSVSFGSVRATGCGHGCYRATIPRPHVVDLRVAKTRWLVPLPAQWPPRDASALVSRAARVWRSLHTLVFSDRLGSDATHVVVTEWRMVAPNRLSYRLSDGYQSIIIGGRRWDRAPHSRRWIESAQTPIRQPVPFWQSATDAHVISETPTTTRITFYDPRTPAWFAISLDKRTLHTLDLRMTTTSHFMHERYGPFDAPLEIRPPG